MADHHINLLPPERRLNLKQGVVLVSAAHIVHTLVTGLVILSLAGVSVIGGLMFLATQTDEAAAKTLDAQLATYAELRDTVLQQNQVLSELDTIEEERVVWSDLLKLVLQVVPAEVQINSFEIVVSEASEAEPTLLLTGRSDTRTALVILESKLRDLVWVRDVVAPRANLLQRTESLYDFTLVVDRSKL